MGLNITQKLTLTQALLTLCVVGASGASIYVLTAASLDGESRKAAEAEAHRAAQEILAQLGKGAPAQFLSRTAGLSKLTVSTANWAIVRGSGAVLAARGELGHNDGQFLQAGLAGGVVDHSDGRLFRVVSLPLPRARAGALSELPEPIRRAVEVVRNRKHPNAVYVRAWQDPDEGENVQEVELLDGDRLIECDVSGDGKRVEIELVSLPKSLPAAFLPGAEPGDDRHCSVASWRVHNGELLAVVAAGGGSGPESAGFAVNRHGERYEIAGDGALSGPTEESSIRILVASDATNVRRSLRSMLVCLCLGAPIVWLSMVGIGWFVTRRAFSPVRRILDAANCIEPAQLGARLPTGKVRDELYSIAETINRVLDRLQGGFRRERRFTADASHELRGPLTKVIAEIDVTLAKERESEDYRAALLRCRSYAESLRRIVEALLLLSRLDQSDRVTDLEPVDIQSVLVDTVCSLSGDDRSRVSLELADAREPLVVLGRGDLLRVLVRNLLENALRYSPVEERVEVRVSVGAGQVVIELEDRGPGVPPELKERVFDPFFRLEASRSRQSGGSGLGLSIVRSIARVHHATVDLRAAAAGGTIARVSLPLGGMSPSREEETVARDGSSGIVASEAFAISVAVPARASVATGPQHQAAGSARMDRAQDA
jgi:signal transduction histidine kinase